MFSLLSFQFKKQQNTIEKSKKYLFSVQSWVTPTEQFNVSRLTWNVHKWFPPPSWRWMQTTSCVCALWISQYKKFYASQKILCSKKMQIKTVICLYICRFTDSTHKVYGKIWFDRLQTSTGWQLLFSVRNVHDFSDDIHRKVAKQNEYLCK